MNTYNIIGKQYISVLESLDLEIISDEHSGIFDKFLSFLYDEKSFFDKLIKLFTYRKKDKVENYDFLLKPLDKISLKEGVHLGIKVAERKNPGDHSTFYTRPLYYKEISPDWKNIKKIVIPPIYPDLNIEKSKMGAWQVYLLHISNTQLPLFWHALYDRRKYFFNVPKDEIYEFKTLRGGKISLHTNIIQDPLVIYEQGNYIVYCSYWSDWHGLVRESVKISFLDNGNVNFNEQEKKIIYPYDCGICF